ncbi:MAG: SPOR domain-containing protein [Polaromonas sp.]|nr:SPOR domain-containing protein [Polaromonas sp.]
MQTRRTSHGQRGGTLLGLIIGALLGLGAALAVAVYVTKVPVPFLNKGQSHSAENDAAEAKKNKDWDPNAPLAGKNAIRAVAAPSAASAPAGTGLGGSGPVSAVTPPATAASAGKAVAAGAAIKAPVSTDPLGDLAKARTEGKNDARPDAASSSSGLDAFNYFIQAGAFRTPEDAEQQRAKLLLMGFQAKVTEREQSGRTVYRVRLGPYEKKDEADKAKEKLDANSIETALVRVQR